MKEAENLEHIENLIKEIKSINFDYYRPIQQYLKSVISEIKLIKK